MPEMVVFTCEQCGKGFERQAHHVRAQQKKGMPVRYCSRKCLALGRPKPGRETPIELICEQCGKRFERMASVVRAQAKRGNPSRFCSQDCRKAAPVAPRGRPTVSLVCEHCGKGYERVASEVRAQEVAGIPVRYCSRECTHAAKSAKAWAAREAFTCEHCAKTFELTQLQIRQRRRMDSPVRFCSRKCHLAKLKRTAKSNRVALTCDQCGQSFERARSEVANCKRKRCANQFCSSVCRNEYRRDHVGDAPHSGVYRQGLRSDLGIAFRSSWEANFARILIAMGHEFEFEPQRFQLSSGLSYLPDFKVYTPAGHYWVEVKGLWDEASRQRVAEFQREFVGESLTVVDLPVYKLLAKEWSARIPTWEMKQSTGLAY